MDKTTTKYERSVGTEKVTRENRDGISLGKNSIEEILMYFKEHGYEGWQARSVCREMDEAKRTYTELIKNQKHMPGKNLLAEAVVKYYLFQLDRLKGELPYDAMGCDQIVPLSVLRKFQKPSAVERIMEHTGGQDAFGEEELREEIQKFSTVHLDPRGTVLYMDLLETCKREEGL